MRTEIIRTMETFAETVKTAMESYFAEGYQVQIQTIIKNNNLRLTGLAILDNENNLAPIIYIEPYFKDYQNGISIVEVCWEIIHTYEENRMEEDFDVTTVLDFDKAKDHICCKLINAEYNQDLLKNAPHVKIQDLALVLYIRVARDKRGLSTITVKNHIFECWDVAEQELFRMAMRNTQRQFACEVTSITNVLKKIFAEEIIQDEMENIFGIPAAEDEIPMYVATNHCKINGATVLCYEGFLREFANDINSDFYILPSSVHELLFIPAMADVDVAELKQMVQEVNDTQVARQDILSNNVYYYNRKLDRVEMM